jgi:GNAT superfamily N-acetyltransferase
MKIVRFKKRKHVNYEVIEYEDFILLVGIVVDKNFRNQGIGSDFMLELSQYADNKNKLIVLFASVPLGECQSQIKLKSFYRKFGFKNITGENKLKFKDYNMYRR